MSLSLEEAKKLLREDFDEIEIEVYLYILKNKDFDPVSISKAINIDEDKIKAILDSFLKKGLIIESSTKGKFKCLHPRMGLTNIYKIWEQNALKDKNLGPAEYRKKRAKIELLVRYLSSIYEQ